MVLHWLLTALATNRNVTLNQSGILGIYQVHVYCTCMQVRMKSEPLREKARLLNITEILRTKMTPVFHLTYIVKMEKIKMIKMDNFQYFSIKSYVVDMY